MSSHDPRMERWAETLVTWSTSVQAGETVAIIGSTAAEPLLRAIHRAVLRHGGLPVLVLDLPGAEADLFALANDEQLEWISPLDRFPAEQADVRIIVESETNTRELTSVAPERQARRSRARRDLRMTAMRRAAAGDMRWSLTIYPTDAFAMDAGMSTDEFAGFLYAACHLDRDDPAAAWRELSIEQARLIDWLTPRRDIHLTGPDTDLRLSVAGRRWINSDGKRNFPSGEIFTGPVEDSANGHVRFTFPVMTEGREIRDIRLRFENGLVTDATAATGEEFLIATLDTDPGARRLGEFAFGTNRAIQRFTGSILLDEKIGGTVHMAVGAGYPDSGSTNESAVHWDMICDLRQAGEVTVDGIPFIRGGQVLV
ncbi:MAG: aminopeptidase [Thermomicrobiales bacterium]